NHFINDISGTLVPGSSLGSTIFEVVVRAVDQFYVELCVDNLGVLSSGSLRRQLKINHDNLLGFGDRFFAAYTNTDGRNSLDNLSGIFPINSRDGTVGISYGVGKLEAIQEPLDVLDLDLNFSAFQVFARQPIYQTPDRELALGIALLNSHTQTTLFDEPFPINRSANQDGEINISSINFYQDYIKRGRYDRFNLRSQLSLGVDIFDATQNDNAPDSNFFIWRGQTTYLRKITPDLELSLQSYWQLSDRALVYFEQNPRKLFTLCREEKAFILRGYARNSLAGDNGVFASTELEATVLEIDSLNAVLQLIPFIDFGTAWNNDDLELDESTLIAAGLGIRLLVSDNFRARVDWGIPIIERDLDRSSLQEDGVTFNIEYRPF
ncbi:MAG: ShlB/FhaC/HecB family hemolysin secretion/activation protein, partial [Pleurocapsa sp.]